MAQSEIEAVPALLSSKPRPIGWPERRQRVDDVGSVWPVADDVELAAVDVNGMAGEYSIVLGSDPSRILMFFHGGGYCSGSIGSHRRMVSEAGRAAEMRTLSIAYRLAPQHPFPPAYDDALTAWRFLPDPGRFAARHSVCGRSWCSRRPDDSGSLAAHDPCVASVERSSGTRTPRTRQRGRVYQGTSLNSQWVAPPHESANRTFGRVPTIDPQHATSDYNNPRFRKSPRFPPDERSIRSMVNLSRQTSPASSTPWMTALSGSFAPSTRRFGRPITASIESRVVSSVTSVLRN